MSLSVIIATAGLGKRFFTETLEIPKALIYYKTKPVIAHLIDEYKIISNNIIVIDCNILPKPFPWSPGHGRLMKR